MLRRSLARRCAGEVAATEKKAVKPIYMRPLALLGGGAVVNRADWRQHKYDPLWKAELCRAAGTGEDLAATTWSSFVVGSLLTIPDRFVKLGYEILDTPRLIFSLASFTYADWFVAWAFFVHLMATFLFFKLAARGSWMLLTEPGSIYYDDSHHAVQPPKVKAWRETAQWQLDLVAPVVGLLTPITSLALVLQKEIQNTPLGFYPVARCGEPDYWYKHKDAPNTWEEGKTYVTMPNSTC